LDCCALPRRRLVEANRNSIGIRDYSISETTLEQIFIQFAKQQSEETGAVAGLDDEAHSAAPLLSS